MAKPTRRVDRHGAAAPTVHLTAACETGRCARCRGEVLSLLVPVGTRCEHACHQLPTPDVWKRLDASEAGALSAPNPFALPPCEQDGGEAA
jgi:hypothetical protein